MRGDSCETKSSGRRVEGAYATGWTHAILRKVATNPSKFRKKCDKKYSFSFPDFASYQSGKTGVSAGMMSWPMRRYARLHRCFFIERIQRRWLQARGLPAGKRWMGRSMTMQIWTPGLDEYGINIKCISDYALSQGLKTTSEHYCRPLPHLSKRRG